MSLTRLQWSHLRFDIAVIIGSVLFAILLGRSDLLAWLVSSGKEFAILENIIAGMFFTSAFTTAPAIAVLATIARDNSLFWTAFYGALGAVLGDLIIFRFIRDRLADDVLPMLGQSTRERLRHIVHRKLFRWFSPLLGALIIASPLPDELGIALLGITKTNTVAFIPFSFAANFVGILAIAAVTKLVG